MKWFQLDRYQSLFGVCVLVGVLGVLQINSSVEVTAPLLEGITFSIEPDEIYVPLESAQQSLGWLSSRKGGGKKGASRPGLVGDRFLKGLYDGTVLISLSGLESAGASTVRSGDDLSAKVVDGRHSFEVSVGKKRVEVNLSEQKLRAWQGDRLVVKCRISSGRGGSTPSGNYTAGPYKSREHYSKLYDNAPMPWSVQVTGNIFIHGFTSVPNYPASHGCIRMPLDRGNPARQFYEWVDVGVPIRIVSE